MSSMTSRIENAYDVVCSSFTLSPRLFTSPLTPLTASHPNRLAVLLQLGDQLITLLDNIIVLLVLIVRAIRLNDTVHTVDVA